MKTCPFCGSDGYTTNEVKVVGHGETCVDWFVKCSGCGARTPYFSVGYDGDTSDCKEKASAAWNERVVDGNRFVPTSEAINKLPEPIRKYIHDLETMCDPAAIVAENTLLRDQVRILDRTIGVMRARINMLTAPQTGEKL